MRGFHAWSGMLGMAVGAALTLVFLGLPRPQPTWYDGLVARVPVTEKVVALTYDDGPHPVFTPRLLSLLARYQVKVTFFPIGTQIAKYPQLVQQMAARGHAVGNHTYSHPYNISRCDASRVARELEKCEAQIESLTGVRSHLFRPPRGFLDGAAFTIAKQEGYRVILWTVSADHEDAPTPQDMAARVLHLVQPGAIILLHEGTIASRIKDVEATPLIIEGLQKQGYRFATVPELLSLGERHHLDERGRQRAGGTGVTVPPAG